MSRHAPKPKTASFPAGTRVAIVAARFNEHIVQRLVDGCLARLRELGLKDECVELLRVPGAFELPLAAQQVARTGRFRAVICLGAVIRGDTPHFEYVAGECARGLQNVSLAESLPVIFGVLTTNTEQQALDRCGGAHSHAGISAADTAAEMVHLLSALHPAK
jgi:6,7-dimethyl-8-ribityllumazine synthase